MVPGDGPARHPQRADLRRPDDRLSGGARTRLLAERPRANVRARDRRAVDGRAVRGGAHPTVRGVGRRGGETLSAIKSLIGVVVSAGPAGWRVSADVLLY